MQEKDTENVEYAPKFIATDNPLVAEIENGLLGTNEVIEIENGVLRHYASKDGVLKIIREISITNTNIMLDDKWIP